jgi:hypothetical protein
MWIGPAAACGSPTTAVRTLSTMREAVEVVEEAPRRTAVIQPAGSAYPRIGRPAGGQQGGPGEERRRHATVLCPLAGHG